MKMHDLGKYLIGASILSIVLILGHLGLELKPFLQQFVKKTLKSNYYKETYGILASLGLIVIAVGFDVVISAWQASKNK
jgi:hypothetical protein